MSECERDPWSQGGDGHESWVLHSDAGCELIRWGKGADSYYNLKFFFFFLSNSF